MQQITLRSLQLPLEVSLDDDIEWLGESFGFWAGRDIERASIQILNSVLQDVASQGSASTEGISDNLDMAVQRVNYHLRTFVDSGFLYREKRLIHVRQGSVKSAIEEMRKDANRIFDSLSVIAEDIDNKLGLRSR